MSIHSFEAFILGGTYSERLLTNQKPAVVDIGQSEADMERHDMTGFGTKLCTERGRGKDLTFQGPGCTVVREGSSSAFVTYNQRQQLLVTAWARTAQAAPSRCFLLQHDRQLALLILALLTQATGNFCRTPTASQKAESLLVC